MKKIKDDLGRTIDGEDNLARMILIEQAIDAASDIDEEVSRSYAFCDCVLSIIEFAREGANEEMLERVKPLLEEIHNRGANVRAQSFYAVALTTFDRLEEAEQILYDSIRNAQLIRDDFDRRDAILDLATAAGDMSIFSDRPELIDIALNLADELTSGQRAYLYGYLSTLVKDEEESKALMKDAVSLADEITDPITRSKVFLELSSLFSNVTEKFEE